MERIFVGAAFATSGAMTEANVECRKKSGKSEYLGDRGAFRLELKSCSSFDSAFSFDCVLCLAAIVLGSFHGAIIVFAIDGKRSIVVTAMLWDREENSLDSSSYPQEWMKEGSDTYGQPPRGKPCCLQSPRIQDAVVRWFVTTMLCQLSLAQVKGWSVHYFWLRPTLAGFFLLQ